MSLLSKVAGFLRKIRDHQSLMTMKRHFLTFRKQIIAATRKKLILNQLPHSRKHQL